LNRASAPPAFLDVLRDATRAAHGSLDSGLALADGTVTRERYVAFLRGSLSVVGPLEARLAPWFGTLGDGGRTERLRSDLASFGEAFGQGGEVPELPTRAAAYGAAYVVEGSALGGLFLAKRLAIAFGPESLRYLAYRGEGTRGHWRRFVDDLERWAESQPASAWGEACAAASATFAAYAHALDQAGAIDRSRGRNEQPFGAGAEDGWRPE
jgi:heme oxygenase